MRKLTIACSMIALWFFSVACNNGTVNGKDVDSIRLASDAKMPAKIDSAAAMKAWQNFMTPGAMQQLLAKSGGNWTGAITTWEAPGAPPQKATGTCVNTMIMGGRYLQSMNRGNMMGMPFEGMNIVGYDNGRKEFVSNWIDNMGTGLMQMNGPYDSITKTIHFKGSMTDPISGRPSNVREDFTFNADGSQLMTMYSSITAGAPEFKAMEIKFTKSK